MVLHTLRDSTDEPTDSLHVCELSQTMDTPPLLRTKDAEQLVTSFGSGSSAYGLQSCEGTRKRKPAHVGSPKVSLQP